MADKEKNVKPDTKKSKKEEKNKRHFFKDFKAELKKVIWPTGKQVVKSTFATISFVLLISVILVALNYALDRKSVV